MEEQYEALLDELVTSLELSDEVRQITSAICYRVTEQELHHCRSTEAIVASSLYAAVRYIGTSFDSNEITEIATIDSTTLEQTYSFLVQELDVNLEIESPHPHKVTTQFCSKLDVSESVEATAHEIIDAFTEGGLHSGCHPDGVAAGAIYLAARLRDEKTLTQEVIVDTTGVNQITLRQRYQEQQEILEICDTQCSTARPLKLRRYRTISATELNEQLDCFEVLDKSEGSVRDARVQCVHCGEVGEYDELRGHHGTYICNT
jgi:transcription initiation factor TFIIIB Brf1 subunit/transcription initiation factor TFIIB